MLLNQWPDIRVSLMSEVFLPVTLDEAFSIMDRFPDAALLAGGTDLFVRMRAGGKKPSCIVGLERISSLSAISMEGGTIRIGATATHQDLLDSRIVRSHLPVLYKAVITLGSPPIRHMGTIGGNICTASPAGDTLPPLYVLDAMVELTSPCGIRNVSIHEFITAPGRTLLQETEILTSVLIPVPDPAMTGYFRKIGQRRSLAISIISLAAVMRVDPDNTIHTLRFSLGSVGPTVMRFPDIESDLAGKKLSGDTLKQAGIQAAGRITPISDIRASSGYRRMVAETILLTILGENI